GSYSVSAAANGAAPQSFSLTNVSDLPAISLTPATLPNGAYGSAYGQTLTATGGAGGPFTFAVTAGALPARMSPASHGALSATPPPRGSFSFTVMAIGLNSYTGSQSYTLTIDKAALTIPADDESKPYGTTFTPHGTTQFTASGLVNGDSVSSVTLTSAG